jgi:hypothetical protein
MKKKVFDCVEMKRQAQVKLMQEYESRKEEFESYVDFLNSTASSDPLVMAFRNKHPESQIREIEDKGAKKVKTA